ncbi:BCCT family transporter [Ferruginivarius sediminum]|uniref:BCCT family transporter n=1 Tax=Ferruginivarius sediminum TaxID=2661937 RepID=A0A369TEA0_9PROT|nr:BCCT family transporter [Ferruginivarius sediminum]RDD63598.1 BCCT family transporter [Ferruginivarius sediminum]
MFARLHLRRRLSNWAVLLVALPLCGGVAVWGLGDPAGLADWAGNITGVAFRALDWLYMLLVTGLLVLAAWLAISRYGRVKLGREDDMPEFSLPSWLSMLFAAGMGVGLLFWGVAEPVLHFDGAPGAVPGTREAARHALTVTLFHWGFHAWAIYGMVALALAYFAFRRGSGYQPGAGLRAELHGRWVEGLAYIANVTAVVAIALGVAGSIAMGVFQLQRGLFVFAEVDPNSLTVSGYILAALVVAYCLPLVMPLDKGVKWLSNANMLLAVAIMLFLLLAGPTAFLMRGFVTAFGDYLTELARMSFQLFTFQDRDVAGWFQGWTLTYFFWWIAWAPFVGVFIARISRGRTIREFIVGVILVPTLFSILWFAVFGGFGLYEEMYGLGGVVAMVRHDVSIALFTLLERLPFAGLLNVAAMVLAFVFLVTSVVSAAYVLGLLSGPGSNPSWRSKLAWGMVLGVLGAAMIVAGNIQAVRALSVLGALPFAAIMVLQVVALLRALRADAATERIWEGLQ